MTPSERFTSTASATSLSPRVEGLASTIQYRKRGLALSAGLVLFGVVALATSRTAEDRTIALGERVLGAIWIVSGLVVVALVISTALQNGDPERPNPEPALTWM